MSLPYDPPSHEDPGLDQRMEELLCEFFAREIPAGLPAEQIECETPATNSRWGFAENFPHWLTITLAVSILLGAWGASWWMQRSHRVMDRPAPLASNNPPTIEPTLVDWRSDILPDRQSGAVSSWTTERKVGDKTLRYKLTDGARELDRRFYSTANGQREQRLEFRWTTVVVTEPSTGQEIEATVPELVVEILPVEEQ